MSKYALAGIAILIGLLGATPSPGAGFTFKGGFWWKSGVPHKRSVVYVNSVPTYSYTPARANASAKVIINQPSPPRDWKVKVLDLAQAQQDNQYYLQALAALGYKVSAYNSYGGLPGYGGGSYQLSQQGVSGTTIYGVNGYNASSLFGDLDINRLYQANARLAEQANEYGAAATERHGELVNRAGANHARVATIIADAQAYAARMAALRQDASTFSSTSTTITPTVPVVPPLPQQPVPGQGQLPGQPLADPVRAALEGVVGKRCLNCHDGNTKKGGFDLTKPQLTDAEWAKACDLVQQGKMPLDASGKPTPLPPEEKALFKKGP